MYGTEYFTSKLYPNGEATIGLVSHRKKKKPQSEKRFDRDYWEHREYLEIQENFKTACDRDPSLLKQADRPGGISAEDRYQERRANATKRRTKGLKGITSYGGRMVRNAAHCMQKTYGRKRLAFWTLTLPSHEPYLILWVNVWGDLVRKLIQEIQRELRRQNAPDHVVGVTEIHPKRSEKMGWAVPHLHLITNAWDGITRTKDGRWQFYIPYEKVKEIWQRILINAISQFLGDELELDKINPRVNIQSVKKNAEGYLGKYMSKGKKDVEKYIADGKEHSCLIRHWWHCTKELRNAVKGMVKTLPIDILTAILQKVNLKMRGVCQYLREIKKQIGEAEKTIGYVLKLKPAYNETTINEITQALNTA